MYQLLVIDLSKSKEEVMDMMCSAVEVMMQQAHDQGYDEGVKDAEIEALKDYIDELEEYIDELEEEIEDLEADIDADDVIINTFQNALVEDIYKKVYGCGECGCEDEDLELVEDNEEPYDPDQNCGVQTYEMPVNPVTIYNDFGITEFFDAMRKLSELIQRPIAPGTPQWIVDTPTTIPNPFYQGPTCEIISAEQPITGFHFRIA